MVPVDNAVTLSLTLLLGLGLPILFNIFYSKQIATKKVAELNGDVIELLIDESVGRDLPIHLSLRSGKSYIGYVIESQFIWQNDPDIALIPIASGYRDKKTQKLVLTTYYSSIIYEFAVASVSKNINDFRIVIPMSEVISARYFDEEIYDRFQIDDSTNSSSFPI